MASKKVLLVTNRRPENPGGRAEKVATRSRLLADLGWEVVVGHVPEPYVLGFPLRLVSLVRTGRRESVDAVLSMNNPFHLHLLGYLTSTVLRVPWVAEFRDPILPRPDLERGSVKWYPAATVEWLVAHRADRVVWFDGIQIPENYFETTYGDVSADTFVCLPPMGYEREKFENATPTEYDQFTLTYAGSFYEGWIEPYDFIEGLGRYVETGEGDIHAQFFGDWDDDYQRAAEREGVASLVETHDFVPHEEIVPILKGSDVVLYVGGDDPENVRNIPSKIFDYVGARTPILAIVDPSFRVAEFIRNEGLGVVVPPGDPEAVAAGIESIRSGTFDYDPDPALFDRLTRSKTATEIAETLDDVTEG